MKFAFVNKHLGQHRVKQMCHMLGISGSRYYLWKNRGKSRREVENAFILEKIKGIHRLSDYTYGSSRITHALRKELIYCSQPRVARLMRKNGIRSNMKRKFKFTTDSHHKYPVAENLVSQNLSIGEPNKLWLSDITYIYTREGWLYLSVVMDLFNREIIGWARDKRLKRQLVIDACERAILKRRPDEGLIFHSDRGSQYASGEFRKLLRNQRITQSMSGKGNCYDNAVMESFFGTLKTELVYPSPFDTREEAKQKIFEYIEIFYNRRRLHSSLGYKTPLEFVNEKKVA